MAARSTNTFAELAQRMASDLGQAMMTFGPSDAQRCQELIAALRQLADESAQEAVQQQAQQMQGQPGVPASYAAPTPSVAGAPGSGGVAPMPSAPNADELRRFLGAGQ